jgi:hypothetical protein
MEVSSYHIVHYTSPYLLYLLSIGDSVNFGVKMKPEGLESTV